VTAPRETTRLYRLLLRFLPGPFRDRFGGDMEAVLRHRLENAQGAPSRLWVWTRAVVDLLTVALAVRVGGFDSNEEDKKGGMGMRTTLQDIRYGVRALRAAPFFSAISVATLAVGIGASVATFSVANAVLFKPLPYTDADRLVAVWPGHDFNAAMTREALEACPALRSITGMSGWGLTLTGMGTPLPVKAERVSPSHFRVLGVAPMLGRTFVDEDGLPGNADVVILSYDFWTRVFGADPAVVGRSYDFSGADADTHVVIGVMPPGFRPVVGKPEVWVPITVDPALPMEKDDTWFVNHRIARLAPGVTLDQATEQIRAFARTVRQRLPRQVDENEVASASVEPLRSYLADGMGPALWAILGAVSLVLLMACANVANLLLARGEARRRDLSVRTALGAGRTRLLQMLLVESGLIGLLGGVLGVALSYGLLHLVVAGAPKEFPRIGDVAVDGTVLLYALAVTVASTVVAGLIPALKVSSVDATASLAGTGRASSARRASRLTPALVATEVALAVVVTVGSGLMLRSVGRLMDVDPGLEAKGVLVLQTNPPERRYSSHEESEAYFAQVLERVRALPDVESAGAIHILPGTPGNWSFPTWPEGVDLPEGTVLPLINFRMVWPGYFETVRMRLLQGRLMQSSDDAGSEKVVVVNEAFVKKFWPTLEPLGRTLRTLHSNGPSWRVVGVVSDVHQSGLADPPQPEMYFPQAQWGWAASFWIMARTRGPGSPLAHADAVQDAVWTVDRDVPITGVNELSEVFGASAAATRFFALLFSSFGALALALGAVGVFGVTSFTVGRRVPEFGVRIALGSSRAAVLRNALGGSLLPVLAGLGVGLAGAAAASRTLRSALFQVTPTDPLTFLLAGLTLLVVALSASALPAWRASRVDPVRVLNAE
jgi:putative ABC transport system permease protein